jgi:cathepsin A (carboxypeptidase C)
VENGPNIIQNDGSFLSNPFAWNLGANLLYIDSPPGTGFSTTNSSEGIDTTERAIALDLYNALQAFFRYNNSQYRNGADFYIAGESYAGILRSKFLARPLISRIGGKESMFHFWLLSF